VVDRILLGAVERAVERKEDKASTIESLSYLGYSKEEIEEAISLISKKEKKMPLEKAPEQKEQVAKQIKEKASIKGDIISASIAGFVLVVCVIAYLILMGPTKACKTTTGMQEVIFGLNLSCNVIKIANVQSIIIFVIVLVVFLISLFGKRFSR